MSSNCHALCVYLVWCLYDKLRHFPFWARIHWHTHTHTHKVTAVNHYPTHGSVIADMGDEIENRSQIGSNHLLRFLTREEEIEWLGEKLAGVVWVVPPLEEVIPTVNTWKRSLGRVLIRSGPCLPIIRYISQRSQFSLQMQHEATYRGRTVRAQNFISIRSYSFYVRSTPGGPLQALLSRRHVVMPCTAVILTKNLARCGW